MTTTVSRRLVGKTGPQRRQLWSRPVMFPASRALTPRLDRRLGQRRVGSGRTDHPFQSGDPLEMRRLFPDCIPNNCGLPPGIE